MSKGSRQRPALIPKEIEELRWELAFRCKGKPERKEEILKLLEDFGKIGS